VNFRDEKPCECGGRYLFYASGDAEFGFGKCSTCGKSAHLMNGLSVSVTAERLLYRSKSELDNGDFSLSIIIGTMAVESFLTRLFLKLKKMDNYAAVSTFPTEGQEAEWESEYPRSGGFAGPSGFVSKRVAGTSFDKFVSENAIASAIFSRLPNPSNVAPAQYFQDELFRRRNRIAHWGYVNSSRADAELCHTVAVAIVAILREMDRSKYANL
jgi:hypothetical protein